MLSATSTQNLTVVLRLIQWGVVILIFLFFMRVIRAVWVEVRPGPLRISRRERRRQEKAAQAPRPSKKKKLHLEVLEPPDHEGLIFDLDEELTIGRSPGCGVPVTYDSYSSTVHARLFRQGNQLWVEDLNSTNGTYVNSERLTRPHRLGKGDLLQVGGTVFEVTK